MARMGIAPHVIEKVLNHQSGVISGVAAVYNRHGYEAEKREALEQWADKISRAKMGTIYATNGQQVRLALSA
jgi:hypothetical protein